MVRPWLARSPRPGFAQIESQSAPLRCAKCEDSIRSKPYRSSLGPFERLFLAVVRAVFVEATSKPIPSRIVRAVFARLRRLAVPAATLPTSLTRFRYIDDRLFVPHCAIIDFATGRALPSRMIRAVLARQRADALPAAGLPVVRAAICGWTALLTYCDASITSLDGANFVALENGLALWSECRRTSTLRHRLATGLALHRYGLWSLRLPKPFATALIKADLGIHASSVL
jgi:hypothetical protein